MSHIFQKAGAAIDGTYIFVRCPTRLHEQYITRKLTYAIQLQAVCDHKGKFIDIFTGYPGSVHDQRIFANSPLFQRATFPPSDYFLLGDSGYKLSIQPLKILVPYKENRGQLTPEKRRFNQHHSLARNIIEKSFGMMKMRWRFLLKSSELKIEKTVKVIAACCIMHNICCEQNDVFEPDQFEEDDLELGNEGVDEQPAIAFRDDLCAMLNQQQNF